MGPSYELLYKLPLLQMLAEPIFMLCDSLGNGSTMIPGRNKERPIHCTRGILLWQDTFI